ncbi:MAG: peptidoglycan editing factor PgeF [Deltaproteobacteria bacterium]|nr:peptidoglycan editing factor PgeF [Deltaproteobacteria bacterium]
MTASRENLETLQFPMLSEISHVQHAVFTRNGGFSKAPFDSLNVGFSVGDRDDVVSKNREAVAEYLRAGRLAFAGQVHGSDILVIEDVPGHGVNPPFFHAGTGDAMMTDLPGVYLVIQTADCQAVMLVDPQKNVVANAHVGWRGNTQNILGRTVGEMQRRFGSDPSDVRAAVGPSLGPCCAEFVNYRTEFPREFWRYRDDRDRFDLWAVSFDQLAAAGLPRENIWLSRVCTKCHDARFFSYRAHGVTGRFASAIGLRQDP